MKKKELIKLAAAFVVKSAQTAGDDPDSGSAIYTTDDSPDSGATIYSADDDSDSGVIAYTPEEQENIDILRAIREEQRIEYKDALAAEAKEWDVRKHYGWSPALENELLEANDMGATYARAAEAGDYRLPSGNIVGGFGVPSVGDTMNENLFGRDWNTQSVGEGMFEATSSFIPPGLPFDLDIFPYGKHLRWFTKLLAGRPGELGTTEGEFYTPEYQQWLERN